MEELRTDVVIIGGGGAGLAAALQLGRIGRSVVVIDGGNPRNAPAAHMQGFPGFDGVPPDEFLAQARGDLEPYDASVLDDRVTSIEDRSTAQLVFEVRTDAGRSLHCRRILVATGLTDVLPDIPGLREHWGREVIHCPWCHGWEVRGTRIAVIDTGFGAHQAQLFSRLSNDVVLLRSPGATAPTHVEAETLTRFGIEIDDREVKSVSVVDGRVLLELSDASTLDVDTAVVGPRFEPNVSMLDGLAVEVGPHFTGFGTALSVDNLGETAHRGVFAAGNVSDPMQQVLHAAANGSTVAGSINTDLLAEEAVFGAPGSVSLDPGDDRTEWDERYGESDGMWSGQPNGSLVVEIDDATPGTVLDVGCGEGADAIWLAEKGWDVTAMDVSAVALWRALDAAGRTGVDVSWQCRDLATEPIDGRTYDLVTINYPAFMKARAHGIAAQLVDAVAPGGDLLVVAHDTSGIDPDEMHFNPADYVLIDDFRAALDDRFTVTVDEVRDRPSPPPGSHHVADHVFRATRQR